MKCLKCWKTLDASNRQVANKDIVFAGVTIAKTTGRPLPYCRDCIQKYKAQEILSKLHSAQRQDYVKETIERLKANKAAYSEDDIEDAEIQLKGIGFTIEEIDEILGSLNKEVRS